MGTIDVSIVIPFFQRQKELEKLLDSLDGLDRGSLRVEVIVVQDGSDVENQSGLITRYRNLSLNFLANQKNTGPGYSRTHGASVSRGTYLWFIDTDVVAPSVNVLTALVNAQAEDAARLAVGGIMEQDSKASFILRPVTLPSFHFMMEKLPISSDYRENVPFLSTSSYFMRRDRFDLAGGFDIALRMNEDNELCMRLEKEIGGVFFQSAATMMFHDVSPSGRDAGFFDYFNERHRYMTTKFQVRNLLLKRYSSWRMILLPVLEPWSILRFLLGARRGRYHLSRLEATKSGHKLLAWLRDGSILAEYVVLGVLSFLHPCPAPRIVFEKNEK